MQVTNEVSNPRMAAMDRMYLHKLVQKHGLRSSNSPPSGGIPGPSGLGDF